MDEKNDTTEGGEEKKEGVAEIEKLELTTVTKEELEEPDGDESTQYKRAPFNFKVGYETMLRYYESAAEVEEKVFSVLGPPPSEIDKPNRDDYKSEMSFMEAELRYHKRRAHVLSIHCASIENRIRDLKNMVAGSRASIRREHQFQKDKDREDSVRCDIRWIQLNGELSKAESNLNITAAFKKQSEGEYQQRSRTIELWKMKQESMRIAAEKQAATESRRKSDPRGQPFMKKTNGHSHST